MRQQIRSAAKISAGISALPGAGQAFTQTQALWRFLHNPRISLPALIQPVRDAAKEALSTCGGKYALAVHDWCKLKYGRHASKKDQAQVTRTDCFGYELTTTLLVETQSGTPLGVMEQELRYAEGVLTTRSARKQPARAHLEQLRPTMRASRKWDLSKPLVHVIDREADSLAHLREWTSDGHLVLVRADHEREVKWNGQRILMPDLVQTLTRQNAFQFTRLVEYHGKEARQFVAETAVMLTKAGRKRQGKGQKRVLIAGKPLALRLVVAQVRDQADQLLAEWLLLTNVPEEVNAAEVAQWYYWRWRIESHFKLLKSAGQHVEQWQQTTAPAIARRLLVAAMSSLTVWQLMKDDSPAAQAIKPILIQLSGRLMKRKKPVTAPALLAGLEVLLAMLDLLEHYHIEDLQALAQQAFPRLFNTA